MEEKFKLDYTLKTPEERTNYINSHLNELSNYNAEVLSNYIIAAIPTKEQKEIGILNDNRLVTVNKRETSFQGLAEKFENGEDGIYNLMTNDKNIRLTHKIEISAEDLAKSPELRQLKSAIETIEKQYAEASGRRKYNLKKQLIEMHQEQYVIKENINNPAGIGNEAGNGLSLKGLNKTKLIDYYWIDEDMEPHNDGIINFFNWNHISALLCNYSALKKDCWDKLDSDLYYTMLDLENLIDDTLDNDKYQLYYELLKLKIDGCGNAEIQEKLDRKFGVRHTVEYISALWRNKIPKLIAETAKDQYLNWYYMTQEYGKWKTCSCCGETKLASNRYFSKNSTSKDGLYSICKECRNKKRLKKI